MIDLTILALPSEELENTFKLNIMTTEPECDIEACFGFNDPEEMEELKAIVYLLDYALHNPPLVTGSYSGKDQQAEIEKVGAGKLMTNGVPIACLFPNSPEFIKIYGEEAYSNLEWHSKLWGGNTWPTCGSSYVTITHFELRFYDERGLEMGVTWEVKKETH